MSPDLYKDTPLPSTHVLGKLSVKVVEARGLRVDESRIAKPYVLLQVSRSALDRCRLSSHALCPQYDRTE